MRRLVVPIVSVILLGLVSQANAVSQWSRKYGVTCTTCHSAFPRLNSFGEEFMMNGFQMPGTEDGDEDAKMAIGERLALNELVDIFGIRLNVTVIDFKTDNRVEADGTLGDTLDIGNPNWLQLFTAGTIFKNVSIFIETEITDEDIHTSWFTLGWHNIGGMGSKANIRVGRLSALEWHTVSGRLRQIPAMKHEVISKYKTSGGKGDDSIAIAAAYPAIEYYGYAGPMVWSVGIQNGAHGKDVNDKKNYFGTIKWFMAQSGDFEGSAISVAGLGGTDTGVEDITDADGTVVSGQEAENEFWRVTPGLNVRYKETTDFQIAYFNGSDDNWDLDIVNPRTVDFDGLTTVLGHWLNESYWVAAQYDWIDSDDNSKDFEKITGTVYYFPRDNMRIGLIARGDLDNTGEDVHEAFVNIRTMF